MKVVETDRLTIGGGIPEDCYLTPCLHVVVGDRVWHVLEQEIVEISDTKDPENIFVLTDRGESFRNLKKDLYWVVEPLPITSRKLGRLPNIGEKFWIEVECCDVDGDNVDGLVVCTEETNWMHESLLGIDRAAKRAELERAEELVEKLRRELRGGE